MLKHTNALACPNQSVGADGSRFAQKNTFVPTWKVLLQVSGPSSKTQQWQNFVVVFIFLVFFKIWVLRVALCFCLCFQYVCLFTFFLGFCVSLVFFCVFFKRFNVCFIFFWCFYMCVCVLSTLFLHFCLRFYCLFMWFFCFLLFF